MTRIVVSKDHKTCPLSKNNVGEKENNKEGERHERYFEVIGPPTDCQIKSQYWITWHYLKIRESTPMIKQLRSIILTRSKSNRKNSPFRFSFPSTFNTNTNIFIKMSRASLSFQSQTKIAFSMLYEKKSCCRDWTESWTGDHKCTKREKRKIRTFLAFQTKRHIVFNIIPSTQVCTYTAQTFSPRKIYIGNGLKVVTTQNKSEA